ncbi:MAG: hypothetical protein ABUL62_14685 [Myxococcales bacterium]
MRLSVHEKAVSVSLLRRLGDRCSRKDEAQARCDEGLYERSHAKCQKGRPARKNPTAIATTTAAANASHTQIIQVGRSRGSRGSASFFDRSDIGTTPVLPMVGSSPHEQDAHQSHFLAKSSSIRVCRSAHAMLASPDAFLAPALSPIARSAKNNSARLCRSYWAPVFNGLWP